MARMTRKELLKEPDEFITTTSSVLVWIREHPAQFAVGAIVLLSFLAGGYGFYFWKTSRDSSGMDALLKASNDVQMTLQVTRDYPGTKAEKLAKLRLARMAYEQGDYPKALSHADEFLNGWNRKDTFHWQAAMITASSHISQKEPLKALGLLDECIASASTDLKDQALLLKASILISQGKDPEARQLLSAVSEHHQELVKAVLSPRTDTAAEAAAPQ